SKRFELLYETVIERILSPVHRLQAARAVHVCNRRESPALFSADRVHLLHEWVGSRLDEVLADRFFENRRSEGTEFLPKFDLGVDQIAHVRTARVGKYAAFA